MLPTNSVKAMMVTPAPFHRLPQSTANPRQLWTGCIRGAPARCRPPSARAVARFTASGFTQMLSLYGTFFELMYTR